MQTMAPARRESQADMAARKFADHYAAALVAEEVRHNVMLAVLDRVAAGQAPGARLWTLGAAGACAVYVPARPLALGRLDRVQCHALADMARDIDYPSVGGPDCTSQWFVQRAERHGAIFCDPMPQMIHALEGPPRYPGAPGTARLVTPDDVPLLYSWLCGFQREAVPQDPPPSVAQVEKVAGEGRYMFWTVRDVPVAVAAIARRVRNAAAIAAVYTPPQLRGRGYAGSVVSATVDLAYAQGKTIACLYTDLRNSASNRCYAKIGFRPVCEAWHFPRKRAA